MIKRDFVLGLAATMVLAACTSAPIDQSVAAKIKSVTVTKMYLPEYTYTGRDNEALAFAGASAVGAYAFGVFGMVAADVAKNRAELPYRQAIKAALSESGPSFAEVVDLKIADNLAARGIRANFISAPPKASDNSGYDFANADFADQYALELMPFAAGFAQEPQLSTPMVDVRWRLLERYPNGRLIEVARGKGGRVELMLRVKNQRHVHCLHLCVARGGGYR